jgi:hypothetical protein
LAVLLPRDALHIRRQHHKDNKINIETVARLAVIPEDWARFAMTNGWDRVVEKIK